MNKISNYRHYFYIYIERGGGEGETGGWGGRKRQERREREDEREGGKEREGRKGSQRLGEGSCGETRGEGHLFSFIPLECYNAPIPRFEADAAPHVPSLLRPSVPRPLSPTSSSPFQFSPHAHLILLRTLSLDELA